MKSFNSCQRIVTDPFGIIIFGASGNLSEKKLIPALYNIFNTRKISKNFFIIGFGRTKFNDSSFKEKIRNILKINKNTYEFLKHCYYINGFYDDDLSYIRLKEKIKILSKEYNTRGNLLFYAATPPDIYTSIAEKLFVNKISLKGKIRTPFHRIIIEKPFGRDLESAKKLNEIILKYFSEEQIFRIDHYLGKEPVQNIISFRFANTIFEKMWNNKFIDNIQITISEDIGIENRAGYFEKYGLIRDMMQNHMMQLLVLIAMDPPGVWNEMAIMEEKIKLFNSIAPIKESDLIRGQYTEGKINNKNVVAYRNEIGVDKNSFTETFFVAKLKINNKRWNNVNFYLKGGKRLEKKETKITVVFKKKDFCGLCKFKDTPELPNVLIFKIYPEQEISLLFQAKTPSSKMCLTPAEFHFNYKEMFGGEVKDDYETLLMDCINGDHLFFWDSKGIEQVWQVLDPVLKKWDNYSAQIKKNKLKFYEAGSSGPKEAEIFIKKDGK